MVRHVVSIDFHALMALKRLLQDSDASPTRSCMEKCLRNWQSLALHTNLYSSGDGGSIYASDIEDPNSVRLQCDISEAANVLRPFAIRGGEAWKYLENADMEWKLRVLKVPFQEIVLSDSIPGESSDIRVLRAREMCAFLDILGLVNSWDVKTKIPCDDGRVDRLIHYLAEKKPLEAIDAKLWAKCTRRNQRATMTTFQRVSILFGRRTQCWPDPKKPTELPSVKQMQNLLDFLFNSWVGAMFDRGYVSKKRKMVGGERINVSPYGVRFRPVDVVPNTSMEAFFAVYRYTDRERLIELQNYESSFSSQSAVLTHWLGRFYPHIELPDESLTSEGPMEVDMVQTPSSEVVQMILGVLLESVFRHVDAPEAVPSIAPVGTCVMSY